MGHRTASRRGCRPRPAHFSPAGMLTGRRPCYQARRILSRWTAQTLRAISCGEREEFCSRALHPINTSMFAVTVRSKEPWVFSVELIPVHGGPGGSSREICSSGNIPTSPHVNRPSRMSWFILAAMKTGHLSCSARRIREASVSTNCNRRRSTEGTGDSLASSGKKESSSPTGGSPEPRRSESVDEKSRA